jgi:hypothetical protein
MPVEGAETMSENPYQSPATPVEAIGVVSGRREDLRNVAVYQKGILVCILIYLFAMFCQFVLPPELRMLLGVGVILLGLAGTIFVFLLAMKVYNVALGILLGILALIPCIGLLVLLMVNGKATAILKQNGIKVGLMGANLADV